MTLWVVIAFLALLVVINVLAYFHVRRLLNFSPHANEPTPAEKLSFLRKIAKAVGGISIPRPRNDRTPADVGMTYETRHIRSADGTKLEGWLIPCENPKGTVVIFHGYSVAKCHMLEEAKDIHGCGFACLMIDFRGSGGSDGNTTTIGFYEAHDVAAAYLDALMTGANGPIVLYGGSMGGAAVLRAVDALQVKPDGIILEAVFDRLLAAVKGRFRAFSLPDLGMAKLVLMWGSLQNGFNGFKHNPIDYATSVRCPTLVINGDTDSRVTLFSAKELFNDIPIKKKYFVTLAGAGHNKPRSDNPEQWRTAITEFLESLCTDQ